MSSSRADEIIGDITDERGRVRLGLVREEFLYWGGGLLGSEGGLNTIVNCYERWVNCDEYLWLAVVNVETGKTVREFCVKCAKRGNDVYRWRLKKRLSWVDNIEAEEFFNPKKREVRGEKTRMLFVSLTYDTKRCSRREAWENVGREWNCWITAVRRKFGRVKYLRGFEAFENGYPHVHAVLLFEDHEFTVSYAEKKKGQKRKFRISREERNWLADKWHSHVDVQACYSTGALGYVKKYLMKVHGTLGKEVEGVRGVTPDKAVKTISLLWLFRKQSFSVSGGMREMIEEIYDLIKEKHNSNAIALQTTLGGVNVWRIELIDIVTLEYLAEVRKPPPNAGEKWRFTVFEMLSS